MTVDGLPAFRPGITFRQNPASPFAAQSHCTHEVPNSVLDFLLDRARVPVPPTSLELRIAGRACGWVAAGVPALLTDLSADFVRVRFVSRPPGAEVLESGRASTRDRTVTPAEVFVEAGKEE